MFYVRFRCPGCGETFRKLRILVDSEARRKCPHCGTPGVPPVEEDALALRLAEKDRCSSHG